MTCTPLLDEDTIRRLSSLGYHIGKRRVRLKNAAAAATRLETSGPDALTMGAK